MLATRCAFLLVISIKVHLPLYFVANSPTRDMMPSAASETVSAETGNVQNPGIPSFVQIVNLRYIK